MVDRPGREDVKSALMQFLAPVRQTPVESLDNQALSLAMPQYALMEKGWPLGKAVTARNSRRS